MTVEFVKSEKKHITRVGFTDGSFMLIDTDLCSELCLKAGVELDKEQAEEILKRSEYERAKSRAFWYLDRASHSERGLFDKLKRAGFDQSTCTAVLVRLKELGLIDDRRYAQNFAERCCECNISARETYAKLYAKGVPKDIIKDVLDLTEFDEASQIRAVIEKKYSTKLQNGETEKVFAALTRKGFSFSAVKDALKQYSEELLYAEED